MERAGGARVGVVSLGAADLVIHFREAARSGRALMGSMTSASTGGGAVPRVVFEPRRGWQAVVLDAAPSLSVCASCCWAVLGASRQ